MSLPKAVDKPKYDEWAGEVAIEGYNDGKYGRSFIGNIEGEKTWFNSGKRLKIELQKGNVYSIKMSRKVGTKGWYVNDATLINGETKSIPVPPKITKKESGEVLETTTEINGQAKGNYRTGLMAFICTYYGMNAKFPDLLVLEEFNTTIKSGEGNFWTNYKVDVLKAEVPVNTKGLIE